ncbi:MAG TPA: LexA family transcriptional regulator [Edaphocola sp.]|nr:LexA family transcriptional regulator [Edaphocola sp.]
MNPEPQKIFFGSNLRFLRERKKISQEALAAKLGITRAKLAALESGQTRAPQPEDYINCSGYFRISIDALLKTDLCKLTELKLRELEAGNDVYVSGGRIRVLAISVDKQNRENAEYVPVKAKAGYRSNYSDPGYIAALPRFQFPTLPRHGTFRTFPITGDSMLVPEGSEVTGEYVQNWREIRPDTPCIVILNDVDDFVFKQVTPEEDGRFLLKSLNTVYEPYRVDAGEVLELWEFRMLHLKELPEPPTELQELKTMFRELKTGLSDLKYGK